RAAHQEGVSVRRDADQGSGLARPCFYMTLAALLALPFAARAQSDPPTPRQIDDGRQVYDEFCVTCHGRALGNHGLVTFDLRKFPKDDFPRFQNAVLNGKPPAMPAWRDKVSNEDVLLLWAYVRGGP